MPKGTRATGRGGVSAKPKKTYKRASSSTSSTSKPSPRYEYASKRARGADTSKLTSAPKPKAAAIVPASRAGVGGRVNTVRPSSPVGSGPNPPSASTSGASGGTKPQTKPAPQGKVTKKSKAIGKKYAAALVVANKKVDGKTMNKAERQKIIDARAKVREMRANLTDRKGPAYGSVSKEENKAGGHSGRGIYKALTGKKTSSIKGLKKKVKTGGR